MLDLTSDLSFKVIGDFQGQSYTKHAISALLLPVETQYVLLSYRKSWLGNSMVILDLTSVLLLKVIGDFQGRGRVGTRARVRFGIRFGSNLATLSLKRAQNKPPIASKTRGRGRQLQSTDGPTSL